MMTKLARLLRKNMREILSILVTNLESKMNMNINHSTKISLIGNCQTLALTWYLQQLNKDFDVQWIQLFGELGNKIASESNALGKKITKIVSIETGINRLQQSDYVIFQHLRLETSPHYNFKQLKKHVTKGKLISISSMFYEPNDPDQKLLKGMIERAEACNIDIPAHKIIEKHGPKITMQQKNHPQVFYFLELVREICAITGWNYYSDEQYNQYLKEGYPFG